MVKALLVKENFDAQIEYVVTLPILICSCLSMFGQKMSSPRHAVDSSK